MRFGFETEGVRLETGGEVLAYEEASMGWVADEPIFRFPDDSAIKTRLTAVLHREEERWALLHMHVSVSVPDEEVLELQRRWSTGPG
jgi:hypothetical protein